MKAIGLQTLETKLAEYVHLARGGETILVTEHDVVIAELCPPRSPITGRASIETELRRMAAEGELTLRSDDSPWEYPLLTGRLANILSEEILDDLRSD